MNHRWAIKPQPDEQAVSTLVGELNISTPVANILCQRGINTFEKARHFFRPQLSDLHDPFLMKDMEVAIARIESAFGNGERILIYGDYDVDGTTAVSLVYSFFIKLYDNIDFYVPDRYTEGYGISFRGIDYAAENNISLIIALDCGIKANDKINYANEKNIDFIICDHHRPGAELPKAAAVLDPKREDCSYPYDELSGCGIGFKLIQAFAQKNGISFEDLQEYLDLVAISIGCDIVPITGENRILAFYGLQKLNERPRTGIQSLLELSKNNKDLTISDLVFIIGPRINAAGRIDHAKKAVNLLISSNEQEALEIGKLISEDNANRKDIDREITRQALEMVEKDEFLLRAKSCVLYHNKWHKGVIGIVASRVIETYYRPTIILTESNGLFSGSARSVKGFDVYNAIESCSDLLEQFGGHKYAAGLTLKKENILVFRNKFEEIVSNTISEESLTPEIEIDTEIDFSDITAKFFRILKQLEPFGPENMKPVFITRRVLDTGSSRKVGTEGDHLKLSLYQAGNTVVQLDGIAFNKGHLYEQISAGNPFDVVYTLEENTWRDITTIQMVVKDIRY